MGATLTDDCFFSLELIHFFKFSQDGKFPAALRLMTGVQWLKLDKTSLSEIAEEMGKLAKLVMKKQIPPKSGNF